MYEIIYVVYCVQYKRSCSYVIFRNYFTLIMYLKWKWKWKKKDIGKTVQTTQFIHTIMRAHVHKHKFYIFLLKIK